ncbi:MAG: thiamine pyrophosphate-dependent enzyme [Vicinamibacterales bacterium]
MPERHPAPAAGDAGWARAVCAGIRAAGCRWVVHVPDNPLAHVLRVLAGAHPDIRTIVATREEEAFGIAAGLYLGGGRSAVMLQSSGLGNSLNTIGSLLVAYRIPVLTVMSMRGGPGEWNEAQVPVGRAVPSFLDALGIQHTRANTLDDAESAIRIAASLAFGTRMPAACLLTRALTNPRSAVRDPLSDPLSDPRSAVRDPLSDPRSAVRDPLFAVRDSLPAVRDPRSAVRDSESAASHARPAVRDPLSAIRSPAAMSRLEATRLVVQRLRDEAVVATLGHPAYDLFAAGDRPTNFYTWGSMGTASSVGLGVALARPERRVLVIDGDGSLLMNLGALATIAVTRPANLTLIVWDNEVYGTTGGQRSATASGADLAGAATALGIAAAATVYTSAEMVSALDRSAAEPGPAIVVAKVSESGTAPKPPLDCVFLKHRFMAALGSTEPATQGGGT